MKGIVIIQLAENIIKYWEDQQNLVVLITIMPCYNKYWSVDKIRIFAKVLITLSYIWCIKRWAIRVYLESIMVSYSNSILYLILSSIDFV